MTSIPERAKQSLSKLVEHVISQADDGPLSPITYGDLAQRIGRLRKGSGAPHPRGIGRILGELGHMLEGLGQEWHIRIPEIQSLVVNKIGLLKGLPDTGIKEFWPGYPEMSKEAKRDRALAEYLEIAAFGRRWNEVLAGFGLPTIKTPPACGGGHGGGESIQHLRLKEAVRANPEVVGASPSWKSFVEYALPSLDLVDVLFLSAEACIAVEVKSRISSEDDCTRGIYQTVKYGSILNAMHTAGHCDGRPQVKSVLLLESSLSAKCRQLAAMLGVGVIEDYKVQV